MELTPEERQQIFEEEKIRAEARAQIEKSRREPSLGVRRARRGKAASIIVFSGIALVLFAVVAWRVRLTLANNELVAMVHQAEAVVGATPSDKDWLLTHVKGYLMGETAGKTGDHRGAALLLIRSLQYAGTNEKVAESYRSLGDELDKLDLIDAAEYCHRLAVGSTVGLTPSDDLRRQDLADVLVKQKKYAEAESIYRGMLPRAAKALDRAILNGNLARLSEAAGRKQEADNYEKESEKAWRDSSREKY